MRKFFLLDKSLHDRSNFDCGIQELNNYLIRYALQDTKRNLTRVFVSQESNDEISGYYTLSPLSFNKCDLPPINADKLPNYPVPAILIGRLAVDSKYQKRGIGGELLIDAFKRIYIANQTTFGIYAVIVDAKNEKAKQFYISYGFTCFADQFSRLFLLTKIIEKLL